MNIIIRLNLRKQLKNYKEKTVIGMKELLKKLLANFEKIPREFTGFHSNSKSIWLAGPDFFINRFSGSSARFGIFSEEPKAELGIEVNGRIFFRDKKIFRTTNFNTFFRSPFPFSNGDKQKMIERINDLLLFSKEDLNARDIIKCRNAEIRRNLLMRYGYERLVSELKGVVIHSDEDYQLIKIDWHKREEPIKLVKVKDLSTDKIYLLRVPLNIKTCKEAISWTFGLNEKEYVPIKET